VAEAIINNRRSMKMKELSVIALFISMIAAVGCSNPMRDRTVYSVSTYQGDGAMTDRGDRAAFHRFVLNLGALDLSKPGKFTYKMSKLPPVNLTLDLKMTGLSPLPATNDPAKEYNKAQVKVTLKTDSGDTVFEHDRPLSQWTWSGSMNGTSRMVYVRDFAPGSWFTPKGNESYQLTVTITPDPTSKGTKPTVLRIAGGGWKVP